ncbi:discoidin domain-containing receptor 2 [Neolamprologus brichardi]|uniref:discoidin domain-containing receptor 2 n=1 Tax=Neolamprologus brichardi TaxID=32507 RepID=UPI001643B66E|nr:discoidin domain-containing receptor 2 [Neolamprologus brichardi]
MHLFLLLILQATAAIGQIDPAHCRYPLGMEDGRIKDDALKASSQWHETTGPQYARLNREEGDGAWCPAALPSVSQYLEVDLGRLTFLTVIGTQGRYIRNSGNEFAREYRVNYSRDGKLWKSWRNRQGNEIIEGNKDAYTSVIKDLRPPIVTRYVRLLPVTRLSTTVCMRVELYGCSWDDGLISYSAPEGQRMQPPGYPIANLNDSTYDGVHERGKLFGGLGQLTDGVIGQDDFTRTHEYSVWPGYDYLGWKNDSLEHVEMEFVFDRQRNFTSMKVHSNNMFSRDVKIFSSVSCWFKPHFVWEAEPVEFRTVLDDRNPSARYVTVDLNHRTAKSLRCRFYFADVWMMFRNKIIAYGPRRILDEEVTVRLSSCSDTIILQTPPVPPRSGRAPTGPVNADPHYERIFLLDPQYQNPAVLRNKLPELSQSAEASALLLGSPLYDLLLLTSCHMTSGWLRGDLTLRACGGGYAEPDITQCTPHQCFHSNAPHYAETDIVRLQGVTGSNMYAVPALTVDSLTRKDISAAEFPRQQLIFREKLGEGQFGEVHLCEAEGLPEFLGEGSPLPDRDGHSVLVAVKQLRADATSQARNDFLKEIKIMSRLNDPNIIRLLCVCVSSDPLCMVTEYMENGDLNMFLSQREIESTLTHANNIPSVSLSDLLHMAVQISSGMKYLASLNFVHRDLATRNCLLDRRLTIKIADFGMSRNLYSSDYYRIQGRAVLPIRWMAWESILLGKFTTASDVWAFGVTLWEIFTLCKEQPYSLLSDEQVIENTGEFFRNQGRQIFLYAPPLCPPSLFELMMRCWSRDIPDRPTFEGLYQALKPHVNQ